MKETFGQRFQRLRKNLGLTQEEIASKVNVTPQAISKWENDISIPDVTLLIELADLFKTTIDELLGRETTTTTLVSPQLKKDINKMILKIEILSSDGDKVNVNLPVPLILAFVNGKSQPNLSIKGNDFASMIDFKQIISLIEQGVVGELVNITSKDGDIIKIYVE